MAEPKDDPFARTRGLQSSLKSRGVFAPSPLTSEKILEQRRLLSGLPGLDPFDYASQLKESQELAKLQLALSVAQRGFAGMGATPKRGQSGFGALASNVFAPIAGDFGAIAPQLIRQKQALKQAERADEARLSQAALSMQQTFLGREDVAKGKRFALAETLTRESYAPTKDLERKVGGKWRPFAGFVMTNSQDGPRYIEIDKDGKRTTVPSNEIRQWRKPVVPAKPTAQEIVEDTIRIPVRDKDKKITGWKDINVQRARQMVQAPSGPQIQWGRVYPLGSTIPWTVKGKLATEGVHYLSTEKAHWGDPKSTKYYIKPNLSDTEFAAARSRLGENLGRGEGLERWTFTHKVNPELSKSWYDIKGRAANLTPEEANRWLTTEKPKAALPEGGKAFGTTSKQLTVTDASGRQKTITAVLWQPEPGKFRWKEVGNEGKFVDDKYQKRFWETFKEENEWQSLRPVLDTAYRDAVSLRTDLDAGVLATLGKQVLMQADLKELAPLTGDPRAQALENIINKRVKKLTGQAPAAQAVVPASVVQRHPRIQSMVTLPKDSPELASPIVNPRIFQPWTKGGQNIQLGHGSHSGFTQNVRASDIEAGRKNWPAVKEAFDQYYGGTRPLGDAEEAVLMFSGLWKKLPGVAKGQEARTLSSEAFRTAFDKAMGLYNTASAEYKPAAEINIGKGAQAKNLQTALDDDSDALRDNVIMLRFKDQAGAWFADGTWLAEMRGTGLGELWESWTGTDGVERDMPSDRWADIAKPDNQLNAKDLALKEKALAYLSERSKADGMNASIGLTEFERAAEYLGALSRYKVRAFSMISDSRPSDKDIEILLAAFVEPRDSDSVVFAKLHELQNKHVMGLSRRLNQGISLKAKYDPEFLANLDHISRALKRTAVRDIDPKRGGRAAESAALFRRSSETIRRAVESATGRIIPGHRGGRISPFSGDVDEESTANLYRRILSAAKEAYPDMPDEDAIAEFARQGLHLTGFLGVYGTARRTTPPAVKEPDGSYTIR